MLAHIETRARCAASYWTVVIPQVRAAGERVGDLPEVKNELGAIDRAASAIENELVHRQSTLDGEHRLIGAVNEGVGYIPMAVDPSDLPAGAVQGTEASGHNKGLARPRSQTSLSPAAKGGNYKELERPNLVPSQARLEQKTEADDRKNSGPSAIPAEVDMLEPTGASESNSKSTQTVTVAADASAQTKAEEPESKLEAKPSVDRSVQTSRKASRDRQSQTTGAVLMSMGTQTDIDAAPWYLFRTSVQKKKARRCHIGVLHTPVLRPLLRRVRLGARLLRGRAYRRVRTFRIPKRTRRSGPWTECTRVTLPAFE